MKKSVDRSQHIRSSVKIRTYIFDNDDYALEIANLLKKRSAQINVAVLLDGLGTIIGSMAASESLPSDFEAPTSIKRFLKRDSGIRVRMSPNIWLAGDHSKTIVIDDQLAFLGGMNIGREYRYDWHDLMVELRGPIVKKLQRDFDTSWARSGLLGDFAVQINGDVLAGDNATESGHPMRLLYTRVHSSQIYRAQLEAIRRARSYVYIQNAYFSDDAILHALIKARLRGVDVRVILPSEGDSRSMDRSNALAVNALIRGGVRIYLYPGMSHVKAAIYDGWACFGSANFDKLSLRVNKEINIGTSSPQIVAALRERVFNEDFSRSREVLEPLPVSLGDHVYEKLADLVL
jgi:cardiolipin synthase